MAEKPEKSRKTSGGLPQQPDAPAELLGESAHGRSARVRAAQATAKAIQSPEPVAPVTAPIPIAAEPIDESNLKEIEKLFHLMVKYGASDLHIKAGNPPIMRIQGKIRYFDAESLVGDRIREMVAEILTPPQRV